jgi:hypothetical protein
MSKHDKRVQSHKLANIFVEIARERMPIEDFNILLSLAIKKSQEDVDG